MTAVQKTLDDPSHKQGEPQKVTAACFQHVQQFPPAQSTKTTSNWFAGRSIAVPDLPANWPDLSPIKKLCGCCQEDDR